jgi:hypothetical protein
MTAAQDAKAKKTKDLQNTKSKEDLKKRMKDKESVMIDNYKKTIDDKTRLHEQGICPYI